MWHLIFQITGGVFYLLNKIFLSLSERARKLQNEGCRRRWRVASWAVYLVGLPPWVVIFISERNWIAALVEASGAPAMALGLIWALKGLEYQAPLWLKQLTMGCIALGFALSLHDFGGLTAFTQLLEIGLVAGYLIGTYLIAKEKATGYLWFVIMHISCGWLMWIQGYPWLFAQQVVSLGFIADAWLTQRRSRKKPLDR